MFTPSVHRCFFTLEQTPLTCSHPLFTGVFHTFSKLSLPGHTLCSQVFARLVHQPVHTLADWPYLCTPAGGFFTLEQTPHTCSHPLFTGVFHTFSKLSLPVHTLCSQVLARLVHQPVLPRHCGLGALHGPVRSPGEPQLALPVLSLPQRLPFSF